PLPLVPAPQRGRLDAERSGYHDAASIRTVFYNFGMVGDYPLDPGNVDLSVFHSVEVPKGSGMDYSDGITPFVLAKIKLSDGSDSYIMETGFRERQAISPYHNRVMRFEPRPGYFQDNQNINLGRSPAISNDPRTWPDYWPDKANDPFDPGWAGKWDGYFGQRPNADQESFTVMDDDFYDTWDFYPDSRDATRRGLGLRVQVRGFQWANPQASNVIFWHYDIANESTTDYINNIVFGLYMDSGVGGSAFSCDHVYESDDDNAYFDKSSGLNLVYTWDNGGHGVDLEGDCSRTGYLGYAYLETPGNPFDGLDNDNDGITDERRDSGPGTEINGQDNIRTYVEAHYDTTKFYAHYGRLEQRPAYKSGVWWTGDEDMDWAAEFDDVGGDGVPDTHDPGEGDGIPTLGEPDFDRTDLDESDQIGLTGFKTSRIKAGPGNPDPNSDNVRFYTDEDNLPQRLYDKFTDPFTPARFDSALSANYNIAFLFASGPFQLQQGQIERFSLALAYGSDLSELRRSVGVVQQIYNANYQFAVPPPRPTVSAEAGDGFVQLSWDDAAERGVDPVTHAVDFEGYRIYRSTDPDFRDLQIITTATGHDIGLRKPEVQFDIADGRTGFTRKAVEGVSFDLGSDTGIRHTWTDNTVTNGQEYFYSVTAYDYGFEPDPYDDNLATFPSENSIAPITRTPRGGLVLPSNVVQVRPNVRSLGYHEAGTLPVAHAAGTGIGTVGVQVTNSNQVPDHHVYQVTFKAPDPDSIRVESYALTDSTAGSQLFSTGTDFAAQGIGPVGDGLLPLVKRQIDSPEFDAATSGYAPGSPTNTRLKVSYDPVLSPNLRRPGYPDSISIVFDDVVRDTSVSTDFRYPSTPAKFRVIAHTAGGDQQLDFRFGDLDVPKDATLSRADEFIDIVGYAPWAPGAPQPTWKVELDTLGQGLRGPIVPPRLGDRYELRLRLPLTDQDVFSFGTLAQGVDQAAAQAQFKGEPYVVPNPYVEAASFEPARYAVSGRGVRRIEFRGLPATCTIRIYTVRGDLVQTLHHSGATSGYEPWDLRTKDNLDIAPGLYLFHVDAPNLGTHSGKFAVIK
ncbi:MAG: hypothetical protein ACRENS_04055, partial [Candidatus Eiseniibacteriota bacterium]